MQVLFWSRVPFARTATLEALADVAGVDVVMVESQEDCLAQLPESRMLVLGDAPMLEARQVLDVMASPGSLTDSLHFISAGRNGFEAAGIPEHVTVTGPTGANAATVAEHAMALTLVLGRRMIDFARSTQAGVWDRTAMTGLRSLEGQTVLIIGLGHVGREYAARVRAFGATTIGVRRSPELDGSVDRVASLAELDELLPIADVVVLTTALTDDTVRLISAERLTRFKPGAFLVNVARGAIVDHDALAAAAAEGRVGGIGIDVSEPEPLPHGHPLWTAPNTIISPHLAGGGSQAAMRRIGLSAALRARAIQEEAKHV